MLEQLLAIMHRGGVQTIESPARDLDTTPGLIEAMLADLERRGYVKQGGLCGSGCSGCDLAQGCSQHNQQRLWTVAR